MSYTLFYWPHTASFSIHWLLLELKVPYKLHLVDFAQGAQKNEDYLRLNPMGRVPALTIESVGPDGEKSERTYTETGALALLLAERHPAAGLFPTVDSPNRARALELLIYFSANLFPAARDWHYAKKDPSDSADGPAIERLAMKRLKHTWTLLDDALEGKRYLLGDEEEDLSVLDFILVATMTWSSAQKNGALDTGKGNLRRLAERMVRRESWRELLDKEGMDVLKPWPTNV